jgi:hypothetical protein
LDFQLSLGEAIQKVTNEDWIASSQGLLAMTAKSSSKIKNKNPETYPCRQIPCFKASSQVIAAAALPN